MATARVRRRYDHRFRRFVHEAGDVQLALRNGVPRSTARDWSRLPAQDVVSLDVTSATEDALRREVVTLRERNAKLSARLPHSAFRGQTPDEVYFGTGDGVPEALEARRRAARAARLERNRAVT